MINSDRQMIQSESVLTCFLEFLKKKNSFNLLLEWQYEDLRSLCSHLGITRKKLEASRSHQLKLGIEISQGKVNQGMD